MRLVTDECHNHAMAVVSRGNAVVSRRSIPVKVKEEHDQVETELDERFLRRRLAESIMCQCGGQDHCGCQTYLLVYVQLPEDLGGIK